MNLTRQLGVVWCYCVVVHGHSHSALLTQHSNAAVGFLVNANAVRVVVIWVVAHPAKYRGNYQRDNQKGVGDGKYQRKG